MAIHGHSLLQWKIFLPMFSFSLALVFITSLQLLPKTAIISLMSDCHEGSEDFKRLHVNLLPSVCGTEDCRSDYVKHSHTHSMFPIPAIRHILWKSEFVSEYFAEHLRSWERFHPNWTHVLWRDQDLEPFVAAHFPDWLPKFKSLPAHIMRVDMIRFMILYKYGGTYADLDYSIVRNLDQFRHFHAVITREPELHSLALMDMRWPPILLASPAFMMATAGHKFFLYATLELKSKEAKADAIFNYAGPVGLTDLLSNYQRLFPTARTGKESIYIPPSYSFYPYPGNRINVSKILYARERLRRLQVFCKQLAESKEANWLLMRKEKKLREFCSDLNNMDSITDKSEPVFAIHDLNKFSAAYDNRNIDTGFYVRKSVDARKVIKKLMLGKDFVSQQSSLKTLN